jgi:hypothetical protein
MLQVLVTISQKFCYRKEHVAMLKLFIKKEVLKKIDKCPKYLKQWVLQCPPKRKKRDE